MLRALSLTQRLTLFFTILAAVMVFGLGLVFLHSTARHFVELDRGTLQDKRLLIEGIVGSANSAEDTKWRLDEALSNHSGLQVLVTDSRGGSLYQTKGFVAPETESPQTALPATQAGAPIQQWQVNGRNYLAMRFALVPAYDGAASLNAVVAIDTADHEHFLGQLRNTLLLYALLAVVVSGLLGWLAASQGLAPLRAMRARAATVSGHQFSEGMPVEAVPVEMAELAAELNRMLDRLRDDYRRLSEFSSNLAHELRTPISNLMTQTQVALSSKRDAPTYRNILASNAEELERMARMVADMLYLAKAERGINLPNRERFAVAQEVQALAEFYDAVAEEKGLRLSVFGDGTIVADRLMFRRAVSNLLSNAMRHGDRGSQVAIHIEQDEQGVSVCVENAADDIDPAALPRLFDRFYRGEPSRAHPASEGAGLGLSITKAIIQAHGGDIVATSQGRRVRMAMRIPGRL